MSDRRYIALALDVDSKAIMCEVEAMKAENAHRESRGESIAYTEEPFINCSKRLQAIAGEVRQLI